MKYDRTIKFLEKALKHFRDKRKSLMPKKQRYKITFTIRCQRTGITRKKTMIIETESIHYTALNIGRKIIREDERMEWYDYLLLD